jgi:predicted nucleic acid-binding protein
MNKIISNSSPIVGLSIIGELSLLRELFDEVLIPEAVYREIVIGNPGRGYGKKELQEAIERGEFKLYHV